MRLNATIFKAYDIRGRVPVELDAAAAEAIGAAAAKFFAAKRRTKHPVVLVARDVRETSPMLASALAEGITRSGGRILDAGESTTPYFHYLAHTLTHDGGVMVTASHNPREYNGFKIKDGRGGAVASGSGLEKIRRLAERAAPPKARRSTPRPTPVPERWRAKYCAAIAKNISIGNIAAAIDAAGGSATLFLPELLDRFPSLRYTPLFFERDGSFKKHSPNPLLPESQRFLKKELARGGYHFGALFDGDGDRVMFFDELGAAVRPEFIFALMAEAELERRPGSTFVMTANSSRMVKRRIEALGGRVVESRIGYVFVQNAMRRAKAAFGAEISGHFYFKDFFYGDSALLAFLKIAEAVSRAHAPLSYMVKRFSGAYSSGEINFETHNARRALTAILNRYKKAGAKISRLDGVSIELPGWWANVRPSNTEPLVRLVIEGESEGTVREKRNELEALIKGA